jgi:hypothetical protein
MSDAYDQLKSKVDAASVVCEEIPPDDGDLGARRVRRRERHPAPPKERPTVTYVPVKTVVRMVFRTLDERINDAHRGFSAPYRQSNAEAECEELMCLLSGVAPSSVRKGLLTRAEMTSLTYAASALSKMDICFVDMEWGR